MAKKKKNSKNEFRLAYKSPTLIGLAVGILLLALGWIGLIETQWLMQILALISFLWAFRGRLKASKKIKWF